VIEVLLFSLSISVDAFGYSLSFGSQNLKVSKKDFFVLDLINSLILSIFLLTVSSFKQILENQFVKNISSILLFVFGMYYFVIAFVEKISDIKNAKKNNKDIFFKKQESLKLKNLFILLLVFIFENAFSSLIFLATLSYPLLFICSNFVFHYMFFIIGFDLGSRIVKKINGTSSVISGFIFILLSIADEWF